MKLDEGLSEEREKKFRKNLEPIKCFEFGRMRLIIRKTEEEYSVRKRRTKSKQYPVETVSKKEWLLISNMVC